MEHGVWPSKKAMMLVVLTVWFTAWLIVVVPTPVGAQSSKPISRQRVIDFEDELVEGLNRRPLDSLSQIAERNRKKQKPHLYRKRVGFRTETAETLQELGVLP